MSKEKMLNHLATIAANMDQYDGVFVLTFKRNKDDDDDSISFMANGEGVSYIESVGLGKLFSTFLELDMVSRQIDEHNEEDDEEDEDDD
jgi:hypothetical protein